MLARAPASQAQGLHREGPRHYNFPDFCMTCGLEQTDWGMICPLCCLEMLAVGRRQVDAQKVWMRSDFFFRSKSIEV